MTMFDEQDPFVQEAIKRARLESLVMKIQPEIKYLHEALTQVYRTDTYLINIWESKLGKVLKQLLDFCRVHKGQLEPLKDIETKADMTRRKLKNYANNYLFDESTDYQ